MRVFLYYSFQTFYKYERIVITQPTESHASHRRVVISCVWFCITASKLFTNTKASSSLNQPRAMHRSAGISCVWFCITACKLLQIQKHHHSTNRTEHGIPDFISFMRARNSFSDQKRGIKNRVFSALQPIATQRIASHRRVVISCLCFCKQLANFYKYKSIRNRPTDSNASHRIAVFSSPACVFVNSLQTFTNTKPRPTDSNASHRRVVISCLCFCKQLANFYKYKSIIQSTNLSQRIASPCCHLMLVFL
jgi:hypothetical protein